jgi:hypothetical protein
MYHSADLVEFHTIGMSLRINWENNSISLCFLTGRSFISMSNFKRVATSADLISLVKNLDNRDERSSSMVPPLPSSFVYLTSLHLMLLWLSQLIWYAGNLVDNLVLLRLSFWADLMIVDKDDIVEAFIDNKVLVNVNTTDTPIWLGKKVTPFSWLLSKKQLRHQENCPIKQSPRSCDDVAHQKKR